MLYNFVLQWLPDRYITSTEKQKLFYMKNKQ